MNNQYVLYFDGECIFCDTWVRLFYRLDRKKNFLFCALQADYARKQIGPKLTQELSTVVFQDLRTQKIYIKSSAVIMALSVTQPYFLFLRIFLLIPRFLRDSIYDVVAKFRYKIFGKKELCSVDPTLDRRRFIIK